MFKFIKKVATPILTGLLILAISIPLLHSPKADAETDETVYYLLTDHLGSVDVVLDEGGNVVERRDYLPYGSARAEVKEPGAPETTQGFTGKELDDETGLQYYGARYYDPLIGRFVSMDPVVKDEGSKPLADVLPNPQALNAYSYVTNNPLKFVDPTGMYKEDVHYDMTYFVAMVAGLSDYQSRAVAYYDQMTDRWSGSMPGDKRRPIESARNYVNGTTEYYHFASRYDAKRRISDAIAARSLSYFGMSLHTLQDTYSHAGLDPESHLEAGDTPDLTHLDPEKALDMANDSFQQLRKFNLALNGSNGMDQASYDAETERRWNIMEHQLAEYFKMEDKSESDIAKWAANAKNTPATDEQLESN